MVTWTKADQIAYEQRSKASRKIQCAEPEQVVCHDPLAASPGTPQSAPSVIVRIVGYRTRLLDPDNFCGGCKYLIDGLRHAGLLRDDTAHEIKLETSQVKIAWNCQERTEIVIEHL